MKKLLFLIFVINCSFLYGQEYFYDNLDNDKYNNAKKDYKIFQYFKSDSLHGKISKTVKFNAKKQKIFEETEDHKFSKLSGISDHKDFYTYKNDLLYKIETTYKNSENKFLQIYKYDRSKKLVYIFSKVYVKGQKRKLDGDIFNEDIYDSKPKWKVYSKQYYKYDSDNNLIETYIPKVYNTPQNLYKYYYINNKLIKTSSWENERLVWDEYRQYHNKNDYDFLRIWPENDLSFSDICSNIQKISFKYDSKDRILQISKPSLIGTTGNEVSIFYYNSEGSLNKIENYDEENKLELTNVYIYN